MNYTYSHDNNIIRLSNKVTPTGSLIGKIIILLSFFWLGYILYAFWFPNFDRDNAGAACFPILLILLTCYFCFTYKTIIVDLQKKIITLELTRVFLKKLHFSFTEIKEISSVRADHTYGGNYRKREHLQPNHSFISYLVLKDGKRIKLFQAHGIYGEKYVKYLQSLKEATGL